MNTTVQFARVKPNAIIPSKRYEDMGFDIYACFDEDYIEIKPHETKLIPTGIASSCSPEYGFLLKERGSTGSKGIALRAGVIDSGYRGEWFVGVTNTTEEYMYISKLSKKDTYRKHTEELVEQYSKLEDDIVKFIKSDFRNNVHYIQGIVYPYSKAIAQALVIPVPRVTVKEVTYEELNAVPSERGSGAIGSSGK